MQKSLFNWLKIALINLNIVAFIGVILRYKIAFHFPFLDQKHLLHGHSHFAFAGWIGFVLMILMLAYISEKKNENIFPKYNWIIRSILFSAYGMLISFIIQGYGFFSITFSTLSIVSFLVFSIVFFKELNSIKSKCISVYWFKSALFFGVFSSIGTITLSYLMIKHIFIQELHLSSIYFYLHFQYNGWFFFAGMGLFFHLLDSLQIEVINSKKIFYFFTFACLPAYFLSTLWLPLPTWVYIFVIIAALIQLIGWGLLAKSIINNMAVFKNKLPELSKYILLFSALALSIKLILQLGSTHPMLSQLAFGFRPIVIGYLHLVLLAVLSFFILGYILAKKYVLENLYIKKGVLIFITGVIFNEAMLMLQGVYGINNENVTFSNEILLPISITIFLGVFFMVKGVLTQKPN